MYFPLYLAVLAISAGLAGAYGRRLVAMGGYITDFEAGIAAAVAIGCGYIVVQLAYGAFIQLIKPYKSKGPHLTEVLSLLMAIVFIPFLLNVPIPWPHPKLATLEPAIYFMAFAALHGFFKLATLFAATQATPATPIRAVPYAVLLVVAAIGAQQGFHHWYDSLKGVRSAPLPEAAPARIGDTYATARRLAEGLYYPMGDLPQRSGHLTLRVANVSDGAAPPESIFITCNFYNGNAKEPVGTITKSLALSESGWIELRFPLDTAPPETTTYGVHWNEEEEPAWVRRTGLRPSFTSGKEVLVSGPFFHEAPATANRPNLVVILVEGLGADHMNLFGYERETTPALTRLAASSLVWENAFSPCPDTFSTTMSVFTGLPPLMHGYTGQANGPLPPGTDYLPELMAQSGYVTAAFSEGEGPDGHDLVYGTGVERGFHVFNAEFPQEALAREGSGPAPVVPKGARVTLQRAAEWIRDHREFERHLVFIRLRELRQPFNLKRYGKGYIKPWEPVPQSLDVYDTAVQDVDKQLGLFIDRMREMDALTDTCIAITSPYGLDFSEPGRGVWRRLGPGVPRLTEESLRVPLLLSLPEGVGRSRRGMITLEALGQTLAGLGGVSLSTRLAGQSLLEYTSGGEPLSVFGDPVEMSLRSAEWRFNWQSGLRAGTLEQVAPAAIVALYRLSEYREKRWNVDDQQREPQLARAYAAQLEAFVAPYIQAAGAAP